MAPPPAPVMITAMSATLTKEVASWKRIAATIGVAALVVTASALSGVIPSADLLNDVWADDEA